jgi:hypothetical protein
MKLSQSNLVKSISEAVVERELTDLTIIVNEFSNYDSEKKIIFKI